MPINVEHYVDPRLLADASYRIGRGGAYLRERERYDNREQEFYNRQREQSQDSERRRQALIDEQMRSEQFGANRDDEYARRYESDRSYYEPSYGDMQQSRQFDEGLQQRQYEHTSQLDFQQHQEQMRQEQRQRETEAKFGGRYEYTPDQEAKRKELMARRQNVLSAGARNEILPQERDIALTQIDAEIDSIQPEFKKNEGPSMQEAAQTELVPETDPQGRLVGKWSRKADGTWNFHKIDDPQADAMKIEMDAKKKQLELDAQKAKLDLDLKMKAMEQARTLLSQKDPATGAAIPPDPMKMNEMAGRIYEQTKQFISFDPQKTMEGATAYMQGDPAQQPGIAQQDMGAQQNEQAREQQASQIHAQMMQARQAGDMQTATQLAMQLKQLASGG